MEELPDHLDLPRVRQIVRLLGDTISLRGDHIEQKHFLLRGLCELIKADGWTWAIGYRPTADTHQAYSSMIHGGFTEEQWFKLVDAIEHPDSIKASLIFHEKARSSLTHTTMDETEMDPENFAFQEELGRLWEETGLGSTILSGWHIDPESLSVIGLYRNADRPRYTPEEKAIAHIVLEEVTWLHMQGWQNDRGALIPQLSRQRRKILHLLLEGLPRKEIADRAGISIHSLKDHVQEIYALFSVHSHAELVAKIFVRGNEISPN